VVKHKTGDAAVMAVASNNIICLNKDQNVFDSKKRLKVATADGLRQKLNSSQRKRIALNQCLLYLYTNQGELCRRTAASLESAYRGVSAQPTLIRSAQLVKDKRLGEAVAYLQEFCARVPAADHGTALLVAAEARLALVQLLLQSGAVGQACTELTRLPGGLRHRPGVVAALVTLYRAQEDVEGACATFDAALEQELHPVERSELARRGARLFLRTERPARAAQLLEELRREAPDDQRLLAQLIHAYSQCDTARAELASRQLDTSWDAAAVAALDVEALETSFFGFGSRYHKRVAGGALRSPNGAGVRASDDATKKRKKKKAGRAPKLPLAPGATPDPERWLPRRERSYYRGKKRDKRRAQDHLRGPQGAVGAGATAELDLGARLEARNRAEQASSGPASPGSPGAGEAAPRHPNPKAAAAKQKQKKRKGGKW